MMKVVEMLLEAARAGLERLQALAAVVALAASILLFGRQGWLEVIGLDGFRDTYKEYLGVALILSCAVMVVVLGRGLWTWLCGRWGSYRAMRELPRTLAETTPRERAVLGYCLLLKQQSITLPMGNPTAELMQFRGLLLQSLGPFYALDVPYHIPNWIWRELNAAPYLYFGAVAGIAEVANRIDGYWVDMAIDREEFRERIRCALRREREDLTKMGVAAA